MAVSIRGDSVDSSISMYFVQFTEFSARVVIPYYDEECIFTKSSNSEKVFLDNFISSTNPISGWYM